MSLYMYTATGQGLTTHWGRLFDVNKNILSLRSFIASFKRISLKFDFIHFFFHVFIHVYGPGTGTDSPKGTSFDANKKCLVTSSICCIHPVWSESSLCTQLVAEDPSFLHADSEDSDQTGRMPRMIWVFAGRTDHFLIFKVTLALWMSNLTKNVCLHPFPWTEWWILAKLYVLYHGIIKRID